MIDARALVSSEAELASDVSVGPFSIIGPGCRSGRAPWSDLMW